MRLDTWCNVHVPVLRQLHDNVAAFIHRTDDQAAAAPAH